MVAIPLRSRVSCIGDLIWLAVQYIANIFNYLNPYILLFSKPVWKHRNIGAEKYIYWRGNLVLKIALVRLEMNFKIYEFTMLNLSPCMKKTS